MKNGYNINILIYIFQQELDFLRQQIYIKIGKKRKHKTSFCSQHSANCCQDLLVKWRQYLLLKMDVWSVQLFGLHRQQKAAEDLEENSASATALAFAFASTGHANILRTQL